ncbi:MAG: DUF2868 domain-containing protein [Deferrisomatales bacterium]|nr:DUF2868 domain-containing protein [Deferrisomatales bacterium]
MLAHLIDLLVQLHRDEDRDQEFLRHRDREIGRRLAPRGLDRRAQLLAWLNELPEPPGFGRRVAAVQGAVNGLLALAGLLVGWAAARVLLHYDGTQPVNVIHALAVFVGLQLLLVAALGVTLLPQRVARWVPGLRSLQEALGVLSPGRLRRLGERFLPQEVRRLMDAALGRGSAHQRLFGRMQKWALVTSAQGFAVAFNLGALAGCLYLVAFSDLAFAWSTTLNIQAIHLHGLTRALAAPWSWLLPQAEPSLALIEATRYFRFKEGVLPGFPAASPSGPAVLGGWWPFLLAAIGCYGLLLRSLLLGIAGWRYRRAVEHTLLHAHGVQDLWDRLTSSLVETRAEQPEVAADLPAPATGPAQALPLGGRSCVLVNWAGVELNDEAAARLLRTEAGLEPGPARHAGGASSLEADQQVVADVVRDAGEGPVVILVKAWEPAMLEFLDFLGDLRRALGDGVPIAVMPVARDTAGTAAASPETDLEQWRSRAHSTGDPWLSVRALGGGGGPS